VPGKIANAVQNIAIKMDQLEYIDNYFQGKLHSEEKADFEKKISEDPDFAEEVAFYISAMKAVNEEVVFEKKIRFRKLYDESKHTVIPNRRASIIKLWPAVAVAATIATLLIGYYFFTRADPPQQLAEQYIQRNLDKLGVQMGSVQDSLQIGLAFYNKGDFTEALQVFEAIALNGEKQIEATKYAGIVSLRLKKYDKALTYFSTLENYTGLYSNPGKFYHALTLLKRNEAGDETKARLLLQEVVDKNLEEKETARRWLENL